MKRTSWSKHTLCFLTNPTVRVRNSAFTSKGIVCPPSPQFRPTLKGGFSRGRLQGPSLCVDLNSLRTISTHPTWFSNVSGFIPIFCYGSQTANSALTPPSIPPRLSSLSKAGLTHSSTNLSTCSGALPTKLFGSRSATRSSLIGSKYGSALTRSIRSFSRPSCLTWWAAW